MTKAPRGFFVIFLATCNYLLYFENRYKPKTALYDKT